MAMVLKDVTSTWSKVATGACIFWTKSNATIKVHIGTTLPSEDTEVYEEAKRFTYTGTENVYVKDVTWKVPKSTTVINIDVVR